MSEHILKLLTKSLQIQPVAGRGGLVEITREDVLRAMSGMDRFACSLIGVRYLGWPVDIWVDIFDPLFKLVVERRQVHRMITEYDPHDLSLHSSRCVWLALERYLSGDRCAKCNGAGTLGHKVERSEAGELVKMAPKQCPRCAGTGSNRMSDRKQAQYLALEQHQAFERHGWKSLVDDLLTHCKQTEAEAMDHIKRNLRCFYDAR